jgi:hypothetical protein
MRTLPSLRVSLTATLALYAACAVPLDDARRDRRQFPPTGVIKGTVVYEGPRPCSRAGKIVGAAALLVYPKERPPVPFGTSERPVNFTVISGEDLFPNEPRFAGNELVCPPLTEVISVTAPYAVSPLEAGEYFVTSFFNRSGGFLPSFSTRNQPERGDVLGGYIDVEKARAGVLPPPLFPVLVGVKDAEGQVSLPALGFVADRVLVSLFQRAPFTRPIFDPTAGNTASSGSALTPENPTGDPEAVPVAIVTQDYRTLAPPQTVTRASVDALQKSYVALRLNYGLLPGAENDNSQDPPFSFEVVPQSGFSVFSRGQVFPENAQAAAIWPRSSFTRLISDPLRVRDPQSVVRARAPSVVLSGITLLDDALFSTTPALSPKVPAAKDHVTVLVRPMAICFKAQANGGAGVLITPYSTSRTSDTSGAVEKRLFDDAALLQETGGLATDIRNACLPLGRYAISLAYPTGQSWSTPNEAGSCAQLEGAIVEGACGKKPRPVLPSQGLRGVVEVVPATTPEGRAYCDGPGRVPEVCLEAK